MSFSPEKIHLKQLSSFRLDWSLMKKDLNTISESELR